MANPRRTKRKTAQGRGPGPAPARRPTRGTGGLESRAVDAAMELAAKRGWRHVTLAGVASACGVGLADLYRVYPSRVAILAGLARRIDAAVLGQGPAEDGEESPRDRLCEVMMRRYEALVPYRKALVSIVEEAPRDPVSLLCLVQPVRRSMAWMLEAAGISAGGPAGLLKAKGLALVHAFVLRTWLNDTSPDLAKTMAALDRALKQAEIVAQCLFGKRRAAGSPSTVAN